MTKIYRIIIFLTLINLPFSTYAHIQHYEDLKRIEFDNFFT